MGHYRAGADNRPFSHHDAGHNEGPRTDKGICPNHDLGNAQMEGLIRKIVRSRTEIGLLGNGRSFTQFDFTKAIGIGPVTETTPIAKREVPWDMDPGFGVHKGAPLNGGTKGFQPEKSPKIAWFRRP